MKVNGKEYRTVWMQGSSVFMIEQNLLPFEFRIIECKNYLETCFAIKTMIVRGAGAIGAAAGFAMAQTFLHTPEKNKEDFLLKAKLEIENTRPTAQNLFYAVNRVYFAGLKSTIDAQHEAQQVADDDAYTSQKIGEYGNEIIKDGFRIETHCNAGWLAFVDFGTALSPVYYANCAGKNIFVYVDETRPRSQGARLTAWELQNENVPHVIIPDNAGAHLMSLGKIDMMIVGADRIAANGDVANKIGTLEKAIVAKEYGIPFYIAAPFSTFDLKCETGQNIPIEERSEEEVLYQTGPDAENIVRKILVSAPGSTAFNPAFDVTPAKFITGIITEKGIIDASKMVVEKINN
ncbi:MAG TPA: S-methyl-5-thioribose-1-phosphate isomerase [Bacteroidales bacterium]|nr:MAG: S-methyl-5-thioribose-1-phosphate isomerase [Bacteroidetes bacterium GWF2_35_48]OFY96959.1 MAG: S-methyl-5-thioribose-1-phosphate isomerase [Bacteroidetes bacterium RIFOXYC12_FULL_35_7]HBX52315.1 S-methyl-5-thioribose-1-phosphate isomerase [Bacteroidales bacterium]